MKVGRPKTGTCKCHPSRPYYSNSLCVECYRVKYYEKHREKLKKDSRTRYKSNPQVQKANRLEKNFWTIERFDRYKKTQKNLCALCKLPEKTKENLSSDHDHKRKIPRALLCKSCNTGLGAFKDDSVLLKRAIRYLEKWKRIKQ
jgi:hypothetical protein